MPAELFHRQIGHGLHGTGIGDVADMSQRLAARALDLAHDCVRLIAVAARIDDDGRAISRKRKRNRAADVAARSRSRSRPCR